MEEMRGWYRMSIVTRGVCYVAVILFVLSSLSFAAADSQKAVLQAIQIVTENGERADEKMVSCYFIFSGVPDRYCYELLTKEKLLVFRFSNVEIGPSPILSQKSPPVTGFSVAKKKLNCDRRSKGTDDGLTDGIAVTFSLSAIPRIVVHEEEGVISFGYLWTTNPDKEAAYTFKEPRNSMIPLSLAALGGIGIGAAVYIFGTAQQAGKKSAVPYDDLPQHVLP